MPSIDRLHTYSDNAPIVRERIRHLPVGGRMKDIPPHLWHDSYVRLGEKKTGGPNLRLLRLDPSKPANTVTAFIFNKFAHPSEDRYITPREAARLQEFPDDHVFCGPITKVQLQIGNAVPVGLASTVAAHIATRFEVDSDGVKPTAVSMFSGAGGMDCGFERHFDIKACNEVMPEFCETLRANFSYPVLEADIAELKAGDLYGETPDVVFGGPPCQPFSAAGKQKGITDPRGSLVAQYIDLVGELSPRFFVLENVPGLKSNMGGGALEFILERARQVGYTTEWHILNAAEYGSPQLRRRLFVIGRKDSTEPELGVPPQTHALVNEGQANLLLQPCATVGDAFRGLPIAQPRGTLSLDSGALAA